MGLRKISPYYLSYKGEGAAKQWMLFVTLEDEKRGAYITVTADLAHAIDSLNNHDLFEKSTLTLTARMLVTLGMKIESVEVDRPLGRGWQAVIRFTIGEQTRTVITLPGFAIMLASLSGAPAYITDEVCEALEWQDETEIQKLHAAGNPAN